MSKNNTFDTEQLTDSAYYILLSLVEERHGYAIMQYISNLSTNEVLIGPATLYTLLKKMNMGGLIEQMDSDDPRQKKYKITVMGFDLLTKEINRRKKMVEHGLQVLKELGR